MTKSRFYTYKFWAPKKFIFFLIWDQNLELKWANLGLKWATLGARCPGASEMYVEPLMISHDLRKMFSKFMWYNILSKAILVSTTHHTNIVFGRQIIISTFGSSCWLKVDPDSQGWLMSNNLSKPFVNIPQSFF